MRYMLCHRTISIALLELDESTGTISGVSEVFAPEHLPVGIGFVQGRVDRASLNAWWTGRSIPASRSGLREALDVLGIPFPQLLLTKSYGLSLSDQYWIRPEDVRLRWEDVNFFDNPFSEDIGNILFGEVENREEFQLSSPDNTSDGWLKKKWAILGGKRCLVKGGSGAIQQEPYNEVLASAVMRRLSVPHVPYTLMLHREYPYSVCEDFVTRDTELVSAWRIAQTRKKPNHESAYQHFVNCCDALGITRMPDFLDRMLTIDYIIANEDRHMNNFGAIRKADTLEWTGPAPVYDCGTSLWYAQPPTLIRPAGKLPSKPFRDTHDEQIGLVRSFAWLDFSALHGIDEEFADIIRDSVFIDVARRDALLFGLRKRVELLREIVHSRESHVPVTRKPRDHGAR